MKRKNFLFSAVAMAAVLMAGCGKDGDRTTLRATINNYATDSKVYVDDNNFSCWELGDTVKVNHADGTVTEVSANARQGKIDLAEAPTTPVYAVYPASAVTGPAASASGTTVHLPLVQQCTVRNGHQVVNALMAAQGVSQLDFYNLCALLKVQVPTTLNVTNIRVSTVTDNGDGTVQPSGKKLWGHGTVTFNGNGERPVLSELTRTSGLLDGGDTVVLRIVERTSDGVYYVAVPAVENTNFVVRVDYTVVGNNDAVHHFNESRKQSGNANSLSANQIGYVDFSDLVPQTPSDLDPNDYLPGAYSISGTEKVYFARGNLVFTVNEGGGSDGTQYAWRFHQNQYTTAGFNLTMQSNNSTTPLSGTSEYCRMSVNGGMFDTYGAGMTFYDWGNFIDNTGTWFTLSGAEWQYLLHRRAVTYARYAAGKVDGNNGMLLFPDGFVWPSTDIPEPSVLDAVTTNGFDGFSYTVAQWQELENAGCTFLRANGYRAFNNLQSSVGVPEISYWTRDYSGQTFTSGYLQLGLIGTVYGLYPTNDRVAAAFMRNNGVGMNVRVVRRAEM